jgi:hypothetical protein
VKISACRYTFVQLKEKEENDFLKSAKPFFKYTLYVQDEKVLSLSAYCNNKHFNTMNTIINSFLFVISNTFKTIIIIERDDGKKKQTLEN